MTTDVAKPDIDESSPGSDSGRWRTILFGLPMQLTVLALFSRVALFALARIVGRLIPPVEEMPSPQILSVWGNWDTWHYITIAVRGYDRSTDGINAAFFPVYPMMMNVVHRVLGDQLQMVDYRWVAVLISTAFLLAATYALTVLFLEMTSEKVAVTGVVLFLISPFSFFLNAGYTESILVLLIGLTFIAARREQWILAAIIVAVATATRVTGIFLIPSLLLMAWNARVDWKKLGVIACVSPLGLLAYMIWQWVNLGSPLRFYTVQQHWGDFYERTGQYVEGFLSNPVRWTADTTSGPVLLLNVAVCLLWIATIWPMYRRFGIPFTLFNTIIIAQSSVFIVSQGRFLLVAIGAYLTLAAVVEERPQWPILKYGLVTGFLMAMMTLALLFANGQWVV